MPTIYLSPSTQQYNPYIIGDGTEEYWMNQVADEMIPYLEQYGINYNRNTPEMTAGSSIRDSNAGNNDFHIAIHSNASGEAQQGKTRGTIIFYYPSSENGLKMAEILNNKMKEIYPLPDLVKIVPTTSLGEVSRTSAPSVLIEVAYHDNPEDANWIINNVDSIAKAIASGANEYFVGPVKNDESSARVTLANGYLNIRSGPSLNDPVIDMAPNGAILQVVEKVGDWYEVEYNGVKGYVSGNYLTLL
ncbi:MAG: SH3 domain-containing protein [Sedimentibacter sp.]